jgi:hypothetical protein
VLVLEIRMPNVCVRRIHMEKLVTFYAPSTIRKCVVVMVIGDHSTLMQAGLSNTSKVVCGNLQERQR